MNMQYNQRIIDLMEAKNLSVNQLAKIIGKTDAVVYNYRTGKNEPGVSVFSEIAQKIPDINPGWLLTGKGEMLLGEGRIEPVDSAKLIPVGITPRETAILPMKAVAGLPVQQYVHHGTDEAQGEYKTQAVLLPQYSFRMQFIIRIEGDSMEPTYKAGEDVVITQVLPAEVLDDRVYVVLSREGEVLLKRLNADHEQRKFMLRSDNKNKYKSFLIDEAEIQQLYRVIGKFVRDELYDTMG